MIRPLLLASVLAGALAATAPATAEEGEALPPGAPTDSYQLAAWCYGALSEYLTIYERVIPDLKDIDKMFGTSVVEDRPYKSDMAAAHVELRMIADAVTDAEKASPTPLTQQGLSSINEGRSIWSVAERKSRRELARAWLLWALPDQCDVNAKELAKRSLLLGTALKYNTATAPPAAPAEPATPDAGKADLGKADPGKADPGPQPPPQQNQAAIHESPDAIDAYIRQQAAPPPADQAPPPAPVPDAAQAPAPKADNPPSP